MISAAGLQRNSEKDKGLLKKDTVVVIKKS